MSVKINVTDVQGRPIHISNNEPEITSVPMDSVRRRELLESLGFSLFDADGNAQLYKGISLSEVRRVFDRYQSKEHWKRTFTAIVPMGDVSALVAGIEYYHGARAEIVNSGWETVTIKSPGYQC